MIKLILRLEGLAIFIASLFFFQITNGTWLWFLTLFLAPDISMIGYLKDNKVGAVSYNIIHNFFSAFLIVAFGILTNNLVIQHLGIILLAHIGIDRFFGFGLKYKRDFKQTHIQKV